ncbi:hypothetical protein [Klebsiella variicola]|uniref:hypothetical protein n=1 Tax=Klebsiella variicola TaxID=244366 RepID=UPI001CDADE67|nr:hypothetical protein [Klebsiella variicola]
MTDITELAQRNELLIANGQQTADLLRHLADNEIDSDYFAVVSECESYGKETEAELSITEFALRAAHYVDELVEALEKAQSRDVIQSAKDYHFDQQADRIAELDAELEREREKSRRVMSRIAELESRTVKLPAERFCPAEYAGSQLWLETEVWNKAITACADELRAAGIKVEAE